MKWLAIPWMVVQPYISTSASSIDIVCRSIYTQLHKQCKNCQLLRRLRELHHNNPLIPYATRLVEYESNYAFHDPNEELWGACALPWVPSHDFENKKRNNRFLVFTEQDLGTCTLGRNVGSTLLGLVYSYKNGPGGPAGETAILGFNIDDKLEQKIFADMAKVDDDTCNHSEWVEDLLVEHKLQYNFNRSLGYFFTLHTCDLCGNLTLVKEFIKNQSLLLTLCILCSPFCTNLYKIKALFNRSEAELL